MPEKSDEKRINGILAYGSLISEPGKQIKRKTIDEKKAYTPFPVEFARSSSTRGGAPTLVPVKKGDIVEGRVFVMNMSEREAANMLYSRETHKTNVEYPYHKNGEIIEYSGNDHNQNFVISERGVFIGRLTNFADLGDVLFPQLAPNIIDPNSEVGPDPELLAHLAIMSVIRQYDFLKKCGSDKDGISYLKQVSDDGICTQISPKYIERVLEITESGCLKVARNQVMSNPKYACQAVEWLM